MLDSPKQLMFLLLWQTKWCPAPGCEYAVEFVVGSGGFDVACLCSYGFCWNVSFFRITWKFKFVFHDLA